MTLAIPPELLAYAEAKAKAEGFEDAAAYVADMLDEARKLDRYKALVREGLASGPGRPWDEVRRELRGVISDEA